MLETITIKIRSIITGAYDTNIYDFNFGKAMVIREDCDANIHR